MRCQSNKVGKMIKLENKAINWMNKTSYKEKWITIKEKTINRHGNRKYGKSLKSRGVWGNPTPPPKKKVNQNMCNLAISWYIKTYFLMLFNVHFLPFLVESIFGGAKSEHFLVEISFLAKNSHPWIKLQEKWIKMKEKKSSMTDRE